jgi:hypothetical protein
MRRALGIALLLAVIAGPIVACFTVAPPDGTVQCSPDPMRPCPSHYVCFQGFCWQNPPISDGGSDAGDAGD